MSFLLSAEAAVLRLPGADRPLFGALSITISQGDSLRLSGQSGAGKTALMRHLAGLSSPVSGLVSHAPGLRIGFVFAEPRLVPGLSAAANIALVPQRAGADFIPRALSALNLDAIADVPARRLSKGQAQRIALLRALATGPQILFLDEAASGLDDENWGVMSAMVRKSQIQTGFALVEASHDPQRLFAPASGTLVLQQNQLSHPVSQNDSR